MIGLAGVVAWSAWQYIHGVSLKAIYPPAVNFLFWWFVAWAILTAVIYLIVLIGGSIGFSLSSSSFLRGIFTGLGIGLAGSVVGAIGLLIGYGALIFGTFILKGALVNNTWDIGRLIFGGALVIIGLCLNTSKKSSSKSDDD